MIFNIQKTGSYQLCARTIAQKKLSQPGWATTALVTIKNQELHYLKEVFHIVAVRIKNHHRQIYFFK